MSWSTDECVSFYQNEDFSLQWCIISESLRNSVHEKGKHGYGGIWGGKNASFHHNLLAHHDSRNPRLGEYAGSTFALTDLVDLRNNVIYNLGGNSCYRGEAMNANIVNCYYKPGPVTTKKERIISIDQNTNSSDQIFGIWGKFYIAGNVLEASQRATDDNWTYGVYNQFHSKYGTVSEEDKNAMRLTSQLDPGEITTHSALKAYERVVEFAGASLVRDSVDLRIIHDVRTGTATYTDGGNGSTDGLIDTQSAVGGWPELKSTESPADSDNDGMPDEWESNNNLNSNNPDDAQLTTVDGLYPNIEVYLNSLVSPIISNQNQDGWATGVKEVSKKSPEIKIYLDSKSGILNVEHSEYIKTVQIFTVTGELLSVKNFYNKRINMNFPCALKGIYLVRLVDGNNQIYSKKVVRLKVIFFENLKNRCASIGFFFPSTGHKI